MTDVDVTTLLQDFIPLSFYSEPDGPIVGSGTFKSTILVPGYFILKCLLFSYYNSTLLQHFFTFSENLKHSMWVLHLENNSQRYISSWFIFWLDINTIPQKHALDFVALQNAPPGAVLVGSITYGTVSTFNKTDGQKQHDPVSYHISYIIPPSKVSISKSNCRLSIFYHGCCYYDSFWNHKVLILFVHTFVLYNLLICAIVFCFIHSLFSIFNTIMSSQVNDDKEKSVSVGTKTISDQLVEEVGPHFNIINLWCFLD